MNNGNVFYHNILLKDTSYDAVALLQNVPGVKNKKIVLLIILKLKKLRKKI